MYSLKKKDLGPFITGT